MVKSPRKGILLGAAGLVAGVALGAIGMMSLRGGDGPYASSPPATRSMGAASAPASTYVSAVSVHCEMPPILPAGGEGDGQVSLQARPAAASGNEVASLILAGKEAAAAGRPRDAEIGFLNACRNAAVLRDDGVPLADAMYQLGRHYATVAAFGSPKSKELLQRAERLYSASLEGYRTRLGPTHEKTRFAQEGLITVQQGTGSAVAANAAGAAAAPAPAPTLPAAPAAPVAAAPTPAPVPAPPVAAAPTPPASVAATPSPAAAPAPAPASPAPAVQAQAPASAPATPPVAEKPADPAAQAEVAADKPAQPRRTSPSFNCAQARSTTEKLICGDEELARLDRELGAIHQRAREASPDPRAFQRNSDAEWARREATCRDRECLLRWYAERRAELGAAAREPAPRAAATQNRPRQEAAARRRAESTRQAAEAARQAAPEAPATQARPRRAPAPTATAEAAPEPVAPAPARPVVVAPPQPEFEPPPPPPPSSAMGAAPGDVPTAEGSAGAE